MLRKKPFHLAIDFVDDEGFLGRPFTPDEMDQMMGYFADVGISRIYWVHWHDFFCRNAVSDTSKSALQWAVEAAHRHGMELYTQNKIFEMGIVADFLPPEVELSEDLPALLSVQGRSVTASPFMTAHPEYRISRRPGAWQRADSAMVKTIKLVKQDDQPTRLRAEHLEIWISPANGGFRPYTGPCTFIDRLEERNGIRVRVLCLGGLSIDSRERFILVRCSVQDETPDFINRADHLMELCDAVGTVIPSVPDQGLCSRRTIARVLQRASLDLFGDAQHLSGCLPPENVDGDPRKMAFLFYRGRAQPRALDGRSEPGGRDGRIMHMKGKPPVLAGSMHPAYPEVRGYLLDYIHATIAAGADGADVRMLNHSSWIQDKEEYGFNPPVIEAYRQRHGNVCAAEMDFEEVRRINGEYLTQFLQEAGDLLRENSRPLQVHICSWLGNEARWRAGINNYPLQFEYEWRKWIEQDIVDSVLLKPPAASYGRPGALPPGPELAFLADVARVARANGKKTVFESRLLYARTPENAEAANMVRDRIDLGWNDENIDAINLYEGSCIFRINPESGKPEGSAMIRDLLGQYGK